MPFHCGYSTAAAIDCEDEVFQMAPLRIGTAVILNPVSCRSLMLRIFIFPILAKREGKSSRCRALGREHSAPVREAHVLLGFRKQRGCPQAWIDVIELSPYKMLLQMKRYGAVEYGFASCALA